MEENMVLKLKKVRPEAQRVNLYPFPSVARNVTNCP